MGHFSLLKGLNFMDSLVLKSCFKNLKSFKVFFHFFYRFFIHITYLSINKYKKHKDLHMLKYKKRNFLLFMFCSILLFNFSAQTRSAFRDLNKKGVTVDHQAGEYTSAINLTIESKNQNVNISYNNQVIKIASGSKATVKINKTGIVYIKLNGNNTTYIGTYIIGKKSRLPIISLHLNEVLFSEPGGIIFGSKTNGVDIGPVWQKKSINTYFEYYENGNFKCGDDFKIQPFGGWTLGLKEKSLRIIADSNIGPKSIKIDPFENKHFKSFKSLVFRTSGSDQNITRIKDITMASIARDLSLDYQDYRQAILLVNGKYWGIYNIREKINKEYLKYNKGAKKSVTTLLELSGMNNTEYTSMINYIGKDFKNNIVFESINKKIDLENYINYIIFQIHIQNIDSRGNVRFWKSENLDNRWRWIFYDSDLGCFNSSVGLNYLSKRLSPTQSDWYNPTWSTVILRNLIKHEPIRNYFINKYCILMGSHLSPKNLENRIDYFAGKIRPEIPEHLMRRNQIYGETIKGWEKNINDLKSFFELRKPTAYDHIKSCFGLIKPPILLTIKPSIKGLKTIRLANSNEEWSELTSLFFPDIPLSLEATELNYLYKFVKWKDQEGNNKFITTYPKENKVIEAIYKHRDYSPNCGKIIVSQWSFKQTYKDTAILFGIRNISNLSITKEKWRLFSNGEEKNMTISVKNLAPGDVIYFTNKPKFAKKLFKIKDIEKIKVIPGFSNSGGEWVLMDQNNLIIDSVFITIPDSSRIYKKAISLWREPDTKKWVYDNEPDYPTKLEIYLKSYLWQIIVILSSIIICLIIYIHRNKKNEKK